MLSLIDLNYVPKKVGISEIGYITLWTLILTNCDLGKFISPRHSNRRQYRPTIKLVRPTRRRLASLLHWATTAVYMVDATQRIALVQSVAPAENCITPLRAWAHSSKPAAAGLLLWPRWADVDWLLQQRRANAGSAMLSASDFAPGAALWWPTLSKRSFAQPMSGH